MQGTLVFVLQKEIGPDEGNLKVNGFYLIVVTLSTVGFGDFAAVPLVKEGFSCALMLFGIPVFVKMLGKDSWLILGDRSREHTHIRRVRGLTGEKFEVVQNFTRQLADCGEPGDGRVSKYEPWPGLEIRGSGLDTVNKVMWNFQDLDKSRSGFLEGQHEPVERSRCVR